MEGVSGYHWRALNTGLQNKTSEETNDEYGSLQKSGSMGRNWMLANAQKTLNTFHSDDSAWSVLGAHAFCWINDIWSDNSANKAEKLKIKHCR